MTDRKKPGVAFWATVALVAVLLAYPLSFGPACWLCERGLLSQRAAWIIFRPWTWLCVNGPEPVRTAVRRYAEIFGDQSRLFSAYHTVVGSNRLELRLRRSPDSASPIDFEETFEIEPE
jgi:hypothetical protein